MGNKTVKSKESHQNADADRQSDHAKNTRKKVQKYKNHAQMSEKHSRKLKGETGTTESVESWSIPNFDMLIGKKVVETDPLQRVFDKIKYERNMDVNIASHLYTSAKEKYLIKLIVEGHSITTDIVSHVFNRFGKSEPHMLNDQYGYCCGYVLTKEDFLLHDFGQCNSFHNLNADLVCYQGNVLYLVDSLSNPFGTWNPKSMVKDREEVQKVYEMIVQRWPYYHLFGADISRYISISERYLIKLINAGHSIPRSIIAHVVDGCDIKAHTIDENYCCCYGFILTRSEFTSHDSAKKNVKPGQAHIGRVYRDGKPVRNPESENFEQCDANHDLNEKLKCCFGVLFYELVSCQTPCKALRSQRSIEEKVPIPKLNDVREVYRRIKFRRCDKNEQYTWYDNMHAWEKYLITLINAGHKISIELISHVVDGCHIKAHMLNNDFGCCYGFLLTKNEFLMHNFDLCQLDHDINGVLRCDRGWVYHVEAPMDCPFYDDQHLGGGPRRLQMVKGTIRQGDAPNPRPPPQPAPPPPDLIDQ